MERQSMRTLLSLSPSQQVRLLGDFLWARVKPGDRLAKAGLGESLRADRRCRLLYPRGRFVIATGASAQAPRTPVRDGLPELGGVGLRHLPAMGSSQGLAGRGRERRQHPRRGGPVHLEHCLPCGSWCAAAIASAARVGNRAYGGSSRVMASRVRRQGSASSHHEQPVASETKAPPGPSCARVTR